MKSTVYNRTEIEVKDLEELLTMAENVAATVMQSKKNFYISLFCALAFLLGVLVLPIMLSLIIPHASDWIYAVISVSLLGPLIIYAKDMFKNYKTMKTERRVLKKLFEMSNGVKEVALDRLEREVSVVQQALLEMRLNRIDWGA